MAKLHGRNGSIYLDLVNSSTSTAFTCDANSMSLSYTSEAPEVTTFCDNTVTRLGDGIADWELSVEGFVNAPDGTASDAFDIMFGNKETRVIFGLGGSATGCPMFTASAVMTEFSTENPVDGAVTFSMTVAGRAGSLTASTW